LRAFVRKKSSEFRATQAGRVLRALTLVGGDHTWTPALTANYLKVRIPGRVPANEWREASVLLDETSTEDYAAASFQK
jgi:hypothetical protein